MGMKVFLILWVAIMLGLQFGCNKPQDTPPKPKVTRWVRIDLQLQSPLKSSMQGKWEYCGRVLNKGYFEYTVVPEELKRAGYLAYVLGKPLPGVSAWPNVQLRTAYLGVFEQYREFPMLRQDLLQIEPAVIHLPLSLGVELEGGGDEIVKVQAKWLNDSTITYQHQMQEIVLCRQDSLVLVGDVNPLYSATAWRKVR